MSAEELVSLTKAKRFAYLDTMDIESEEYFNLSMEIEALLKEMVQELLGDEDDVTEEMEEELMELVEKSASFDQSIDAIKKLQRFVDHGETKSFLYLKKVLTKYSTQ
ncbi:hypothetical protein GCM10028807_50350 [Spirosoma daeguense]